MHTLYIRTTRHVRHLSCTNKLPIILDSRKMEAKVGQLKAIIEFNECNVQEVIIARNEAMRTANVLETFLILSLLSRHWTSGLGTHSQARKEQVEREICVSIHHCMWLMCV